MKNFKLLVSISLVVLLISCGDNKSNSDSGDSLVKKRIKQKIEVAGMGMLKNINIESIEKVNDTTYKGIHSFTNPILDNEVRMTKNYFFTIDLDSITGDEDLKSEMKTEGEWVEVKF